VIIEALVNGLPVVATAVCGFARHIVAARAGIVLADPFRQADFRAALANAQDVATLRRWSEAGIAYGAQDHLYSGWSHAADLIIEDVPSATEMR
jgi:UDP-glucose:(heptosyl)LPS alpha-1,3-glucosyltransferase